MVGSGAVAEGEPVDPGEGDSDAWRRFDVASRLGGVLLELRRYDEAERLILAGYEGMKAREAGLPAAGKSPLSSASRRIVKLYKSWGKPEQATAWKQKLDLSDLPADVFAPGPTNQP